jgi:hypothetical protein
VADVNDVDNNGEVVLDNKGSQDLPPADHAALSQDFLAAFLKAGMVAPLPPQEQMRLVPKRPRKQPVLKVTTKKTTTAHSDQAPKPKKAASLYNVFVGNLLQDKEFLPGMHHKTRFTAAVQRWRVRTPPATAAAATPPPTPAVQPVPAAARAAAPARLREAGALGCPKCRHSLSGCGRCNPAKRAAVAAATPTPTCKRKSAVQ